MKIFNAMEFKLKDQADVSIKEKGIRKPRLKDKMLANSIPSGSEMVMP